jgi:hypothetical protein
MLRNENFFLRTDSFWWAVARAQLEKWDGPSSGKTTTSKEIRREIFTLRSTAVASRVFAPPQAARYSSPESDQTTRVWFSDCS